MGTVKRPMIATDPAEVTARGDFFQGLFGPLFLRCAFQYEGNFDYKHNVPDKIGDKIGEIYGQQGNRSFCRDQMNEVISEVVKASARPHQCVDAKI